MIIPLNIVTTYPVRWTKYKAFSYERLADAIQGCGQYWDPSAIMA